MYVVPTFNMYSMNKCLKKEHLYIHAIYSTENKPVCFKFNLVLHFVEYFQNDGK